MFLFIVNSLSGTIVLSFLFHTGKAATWVTWYTAEAGPRGQNAERAEKWRQKKGDTKHPSITDNYTE